MSSSEAIELLKNLIAIHPGEVYDAEELVEGIQWFPLAISHRISIPIRKYLSRLVEERTRWHVPRQEEAPDRHQRLGVPNSVHSVLQTWSISIERFRLDSMTGLYHSLNNRVHQKPRYSFKIHKLLQEATRDGPDMGKFEGSAHFSNIALQVVGESFPGGSARIGRSVRGTLRMRYK